MSLTVSADLVAATTHDQLKRYHLFTDEHAYRDRELAIDTASLNEDALNDIAAAARVVGDTKTVRAIGSILLARQGRFDAPIPNFKAFLEVLNAFLRAEKIDGWIYVEEDDGKLYPQLVTDITYDEGERFGRSKQSPTVRVVTSSYGFHRDGNYNAQNRVHTNVHVFQPQDVANRRVADALAGLRIYHETPELRSTHLASLDRHRTLTRDAFGKQFRVNGRVRDTEGEGRSWRGRGRKVDGHQAIHDMSAEEYGPFAPFAESCLFQDTPEGVGAVPEHPVVKVFDLHTHEFFWVHADFMTPYVYDKTLRDKLILPQTHRDLLDVLTSDLSAFVSDIIEGKSASNVILCKGVPGVGKTLTAEVYAELIERPLYAIRTGTLGTSAEDIEQNLRRVFQQGKRWNCVLLLDEADVFVVQRGNDIEQNAIVAEFLRTLEYFDGLMFMTTNRPDDIDEAIISRCAAIIDYAPPGPEDAAAIWRVMAQQHEVTMGDELIAELVGFFPSIAPRDIKMLLRLALRIARANDEPLSLSVFRRCAMFRAIPMAAQ